MKMKKGFPVSFGYLGLVDGKYILFATEREYIEYIESEEIRYENEIINDR